MITKDSLFIDKNRHEMASPHHGIHNLFLSLLSMMTLFKGSTRNIASQE